MLQREIVTPADIERVTGLSEGNIFVGEFLAPQMYFFRPSPGWSQYATPIDGQTRDLPGSDAIPLHVMWPLTPAGRQHLA